MEEDIIHNIPEEILAAIEGLALLATYGPLEVGVYEMPMNDLGKAKFGDKARPTKIHYPRTSWVHGQLKDKWDLMRHSMSPYYEQKCWPVMSEADVNYLVALWNNAPAMIEEIRYLRKTSMNIKVGYYCNGEVILFGPQDPHTIPNIGDDITAGGKKYSIVSKEIFLEEVFSTREGARLTPSSIIFTIMPKG